MAKDTNYTAREYQQDVQLIEHAQGISIDDVFKDSETKRRLLKDFGYENLFGEQGKRIPLSECSDPKVGSAIQKVYRAAKSRLENLTPRQKLVLGQGFNLIEEADTELCVNSNP